MEGVGILFSMCAGQIFLLENLNFSAIECVLFYKNNHPGWNTQANLSTRW
jgi:hypothetical protein